MGMENLELLPELVRAWTMIGWREMIQNRIVFTLCFHAHGWWDIDEFLFGEESSALDWGIQGRNTACAAMYQSDAADSDHGPLQMDEEQHKSLQEAKVATSVFPRQSVRCFGQVSHPRQSL